jgi:hypothetical protein
MCVACHISQHKISAQGSADIHQGSGLKIAITPRQCTLPNFEVNEDMHLRSDAKQLNLQSAISALDDKRNIYRRLETKEG